MNRKAQMQLGNAPGIVLIVGLVFLLMATFAFVGQNFGNAVLTDTTATATENNKYINQTGYTLAQSGRLGFKGATITSVVNATNGAVITSGNYTLVNNVLRNATATNWANVNITYSYVYNPETAAYNVSGDLQTEIGNNTSIAGIILTISLIGIVLTILIGIFLGMRRPRI